MDISAKWQPAAPLENLYARSLLLTKIRTFFASRGYAEIETPTLSTSGTTDLYIESFSLEYGGNTFFLQTSPEFHMKRLLCAGFGSMYQISKAFRLGEFGTRHNPEFSMLEWYKVGVNYIELMHETEEFLLHILGANKAEHYTFSEVFLKYLGFNPHLISVEELRKMAKNDSVLNVDNIESFDKNTMLDLFFTHHIEKIFAQNNPVFVYDFPATQAALARVRKGEIDVAERFEAYYKGYELVNGYHELKESAEQERRFKQDLSFRKEQGKIMPNMDTRLVSALAHGMPNCSGAAMGVDRLIMLALGCKSIQDVIAFPMNIA